MIKKKKKKQDDIFSGIKNVHLHRLADGGLFLLIILIIIGAIYMLTRLLIGWIGGIVLIAIIVLVCIIYGLGYWLEE